MTITGENANLMIFKNQHLKEEDLEVAKKACWTLNAEDENDSLLVDPFSVLAKE
jgi:hypothetical protein